MSNTINGQFVDKAGRLTEKYTGVKAVRPLLKPYRQDGSYQNVLTKYGTSRDSSESYEYKTDPVVSDQTLSEFYEQNGLFARIIDAPAEDAIRRGFKLKDIADEKLQNFIEACLDELDYEETFMTALKWSRLYGGSIAVMLINDGKKLEDPLDWRRIKSIDDIRVFDRSVVTPDYASMYSYDNQDPFKTRGSRLGYPERYMVSSRTGTFTVHETRCLIFQNGQLPEHTTDGRYLFWGIPEYVRVNRAVKDVEVAHGLAPKMLDRSVQAIYKMRDLATMLQQEDGEDIVLKRMEMIDMARGLLNSMVLDADGEDYDFKSFSYSGVSDVINTTCNYLSAITNIPQTILFGRSPAGMNATGHSDFENYYNFVERIQKRVVRTNLRYLISVVCQAGVHTREIEHVPHIDVEFNPLWSLSEQEQVALDTQKAQLQSTKAQTAQVYVQMQAIDPTEVRKKLADEGEFDVETLLDEIPEEELFNEGEGPHPPAPQGGEDPMAAMMGGGGGGNPLEALLGGGGDEPQEEPEAPDGEPKEPPKKPVKMGNGTPIPKKEEQPKEELADNDPVKQYKERRAKRMSEKNGGRAPDTAPEATRLPEDMDAKRKDEDTVEEARDSFGGVGVIIVQGEKILTATRIDGDAGGYGEICGPGGHIEHGELPIQAARRETEEEFGILPLNMKPLGTVEDKEGNATKSYVFVASGYTGMVHCDDTEMREPVWRSLDELYSIENLMFKPFKDSLALLLERMYRYDEDKKELESYSLQDVVQSLCGGEENDGRENRE